MLCHYLKVQHLIVFFFVLCLLCPLRVTHILLSAQMFFCFHPWQYIKNVQTPSGKSADIFSSRPRIW